MSTQPHAHLQKTKEVYEAVINKVCQRLLEDQENSDMMAVEVIDGFKELWKKKIEEKQVYTWSDPLPHASNVNYSSSAFKQHFGMLKTDSKKESLGNIQGRQNGGQSSMRNELSDQNVQQLLLQVSNNSNQHSKLLTHRHPNQEFEGGDPIKKIKIEDRAAHVKHINQMAPSLSENIFQDVHLKLEEGIYNSQHDYKNNILPRDNLYAQQQQEMELKDSTHLRSIKAENIEINYHDAIEKQDQQDEEGEQDENQADQSQQVPQHKEDKNEQFLNDTEQTSTQHIFGYYTIMKKKTSKKFKICFESMIASIGGKDYLMNTLNGDLDW